MFNRLKEKWKVTGWELTLILGTFALGGSLCGYLTRQLITPLGIENAFLYGTLYFVFLTLLWPFCVLMISIPLGQFRFFRNYLKKMGLRLGFGNGKDAAPQPVHAKKRLAIFASGSGSNARKMMERFQNHPSVEVSLLVSNKPGAGALHHAADFGISTLIIEKERFFRGDAYVPDLQALGIDYIILAGFLWKVPSQLIAAYPQRIVNIHPALLPKYGGKGMYGKFVHEAVIDAGESHSGITIHYVDEQYDHGATIFQATCPVLPDDTPDSLAARIH
ncbi:MAG: phosphoribosylglycinamide formyltransferase, partial [Chitinophagaceae bacterium]|nr:phosphoribosylglycinamide formyltransferase [Chitinophagaceae bacterium]